MAPNSSSLHESQNPGMVTLYVGPDRIPFHVHKHLISAQSGVIRRKLELQSMRGHNLPLNLRPHSPELVERVVRWLYKGSVKRVPDQSEFLIELYVFAYQLDMPYLMASIVYELEWCERPSYESMLYAFENLPLDNYLIYRWSHDTYADLSWVASMADGEARGRPPWWNMRGNCGPFGLWRVCSSADRRTWRSLLVQLLFENPLSFGIKEPSFFRH